MSHIFISPARFHIIQHTLEHRFFLIGTLTQTDHVLCGTALNTQLSRQNSARAYVTNNNTYSGPIHQSCRGTVCVPVT